MRASVRAAIAAAAHRTLMVLFPKKIAYTELFMRQMMALIGDQPTVIKLGIDIGRSAADTMLKVRDFDGVAEFNDGSETDGTNKLKKGLNNSLDLEPLASKLVGSDNSTTEWRVDPITKFEKAIGGYWSFVKPFVLDPKELFIPPKPPQDTEVNFVKALNEVREKGGIPIPSSWGIDISARPREQARMILFLRTSDQKRLKESIGLTTQPRCCAHHRVFTI